MIRADNSNAMAGPFVPMPGVGTRLTANALGYILSSNKRGNSFGHPWKPALSGFNLRLAKGVVIDMQGGKAFEPRINGVKIGGEPGRVQPVLRLDPKMQNEKGESWVCVEVEPDAEGVIIGDERVRIVQGSQPKYSGRVEVGREPLVLIVWQKGYPRMVEAVAMFHFEYLFFRPPSGAGNVQHHFL